MEKILIIEDDLSIAELEKDYLEIDGFEVEIQKNGLKGKQRALEEDFDLIILDLMLPDLDGFKICKEIRDKIAIPILMVSAKGDNIDKIRGLGLGADDYITKPFSPSELVARVKSHIKRFNRLTNSKESGVKTNEVIDIRGLKIDDYSKTVFVDDKEINLASKEYEILLLMARNLNKVFSKEEIFEKVWSVDSLGDISTVTVHIRKIREKIESNPSEPKYIETLWGVGYRIKS
ncbi:MAG: response regulator transcription factor [Peptostreptococcaceae bacterium]|jgi:DNA-binding response OmpR family regulator|nr:response regulator transcription factor [Peptostreptococcaceae bacterium]